MDAALFLPVLPELILAVGAMALLMIGAFREAATASGGLRFGWRSVFSLSRPPPLRLPNCSRRARSRSTARSSTTG